MSTAFTHDQVGLIFMALGLCCGISLLAFAWWLSRRPPSAPPKAPPKYSDRLRHRLNKSQRLESAAAAKGRPIKSQPVTKHRKHAKGDKA